MRISGSGGERNPTHQLQERLDQQAVIADLGLKALSNTGLEELLDEAVCRVAATLQVDCCNLYELRPDEGKLSLRACAMPFQRLHSNEAEGTGIGLATVQRVIRATAATSGQKVSLVPGNFYFTLGKDDRARVTAKATQA